MDPTTTTGNNNFTTPTTAAGLAQALFPGSWVLQSHRRTRGGQAVDDCDETFGARPTGTLQYSTDGYMAAVLASTTATQRPQEPTLPAQPGQSDEMWALVGRHSLAYSGPYSIERATYEHEDGVENGSSSFISSGSHGLAENAELKGVVVHGDVTATTLPSFVGSRQKRSFTFSDRGQKLQLVADLGNGVVDTLLWSRAPARKTAG